MMMNKNLPQEHRLQLTRKRQLSLFCFLLMNLLPRNGRTFGWRIRSAGKQWVKQRQPYLPASILWPRFLSNQNSPSSSNLDNASIISLQKATSTAILQSQSSSSSSSTPQTAQDFLQLQKDTFDSIADWFADTQQAIPDELVPIYEAMTQVILQKAFQNRPQPAEGDTVQPIAKEEEEEEEHKQQAFRLLDVACGTGALFPFYLQIADQLNLSMDITGVDLSKKMVELAHARLANILSASSLSNPVTTHTIRVLESDISQYKGDDSANGAQQTQLFDAIVANACFGNFWDPLAILRHLSSLLKVNGLLFVTHPLGADFVRKLHEESPETVPHLLPSKERWMNWTTTQSNLPLRLVDFQEQVQLTDKEPGKPIYIASLERVRHQTLPEIIRLRGVVDAGYGRGGKKLGFPTANLPSRLFQDALKAVQPGVYFGYAVLEDHSKSSVKKGRNCVHKAVVNVGFSPTFEGQENKEKVVEAHLLLEPDTLDPVDFYGETMRLQLHAFLRPEMKFPSFPALIAQITADARDSKAALDTAPYEWFKRDPFLQQCKDDKNDNNIWIGQSGGNDTASWDFETLETALQSHK